MGRRNAQALCRESGLIVKHFGFRANGPVETTHILFELNFPFLKVCVKARMRCAQHRSLSRVIFLIRCVPKNTSIRAEKALRVADGRMGVWAIVVWSRQRLPRSRRSIYAMVLNEARSGTDHGGN